MIAHSHLPAINLVMLLQSCFRSVQISANGLGPGTDRAAESTDVGFSSRERCLIPGSCCATSSSSVFLNQNAAFQVLEKQLEVAQNECTAHKNQLASAEVWNTELIAELERAQSESLQAKQVWSSSRVELGSEVLAAGHFCGSWERSRSQ